MQPVDAVKLLLSKQVYNTELTVECKPEGTNLDNDDGRDESVGRTSFQVTGSVQVQTWSGPGGLTPLPVHTSGIQSQTRSGPDGAHPGLVRELNQVVFVYFGASVMSSLR